MSDVMTELSDEMKVVVLFDRYMAIYGDTCRGYPGLRDRTAENAPLRAKMAKLEKAGSAIDEGLWKHFMKGGVHAKRDWLDERGIDYKWWRTNREAIEALVQEVYDR